MGIDVEFVDIEKDGTFVDPFVCFKVIKVLCVNVESELFHLFTLFFFDAVYWFCLGKKGLV